MLALVAIILIVWLVAALSSGALGSGSWRPQMGSSSYGWLVVGSLVLSLVMARLGFPFVFLVLPPIFFVFRPHSKSDD